MQGRAPPPPLGGRRAAARCGTDTDMICATVVGSRATAALARTQTARRTPPSHQPPPTMQREDDDPPTPTSHESSPPERSKLKQTLHTLRSPFRSGSPFHIGTTKRTGSFKSHVAEDASQENRKTRKKIKKAKSETVPAGGPSGMSGNKRGEDFLPSKQKREGEGGSAARGRGAAGALVRKLSGKKLKECRGGEESTSRGETPAPMPSPPLATDADSHSSSTREMEEPPAPPPLPPSSEDRSSSTPPSTPAAALEVYTADPTAVATMVATDHPVSTLPFAKSSWKRRSLPEIPRPVEEPSPESALKRRIEFVAQASLCMSEERGEEEDEDEEEVGSLERAVELARLRLGRADFVQTPPAGRASSTSQQTGHTEVESDRESEGRAEAMPAYGDLFTSQDKPQDMGVAQSSSHASAPGGERREHLYKILVIGELGTGKTSIIKRYVHQFFSQHYRATIGVDFALKVLNWDTNTIIRLQLWDIAGQERFGNMTRVYYKEAVGAFIVFDVTRVATFDAVLKWKTDLDSKVQLPDGSPIPCILLANKCDQQKEGIVNSSAKMEEYCREKGFAGWFETSAKENVNIEEAARSLVNKILLNDKLLQSSDSKDNDRIALDHRIANGDNARDGTNKNCAC